MNYLYKIVDEESDITCKHKGIECFLMKQEHDFVKFPSL